ncbi:MAG TPA: hypothetical protein VHG51_17800 [Longimicrobiaceae bacterium]|nr:hypothetical protein [Longimicrobiaceae bacterium]
MSDDFRAQLIAHAQTALDRAGRALSEAATNQYLVLPFFQLLGYDPLDPDEIIPEAHASFSDKFRNRVDFAICKDGEPVIAVESKKVGSLNEGHRGELKGYFNAVPSVKLGILTDGLVYQLYTDTGLENMMDDEPFMTVDLTEVAQERVTDDALDALVKLRKGTFDPADVGADAKRKLYMASYVEALDRNFRVPHESLVRTLMDLAQIEGRRTGKLVEEHAPIIHDALQAFFDRKILERVGFATRQDLVRVAAAAPPAAAVVETAAEVAPQPSSAELENGVVTTEVERAVFEHVRTRLAFLLAGNEEGFQRLRHLYPVDFKTVFCVCYKQDRKGKLFNFWEGSSPRYRFEFPGGEQIQTDNLIEIDTPLLTAYLARVEELG